MTTCPCRKHTQSSSSSSSSASRCQWFAHAYVQPYKHKARPAAAVSPLLVMLHELTSLHNNPLHSTTQHSKARHSPPSPHQHTNTTTRTCRWVAASWPLRLPSWPPAPHQSRSRGRRAPQTLACQHTPCRCWRAQTGGTAQHHLQHQALQAHRLMTEWRWEMHMAHA
jgi:hypothetical protein